MKIANLCTFFRAAFILFLLPCLGEACGNRNEGGTDASADGGAASDGASTDGTFDGDAGGGDDGGADAGLLHIKVRKGCNPLATGNPCILPYPSSYFQKDDPSSPTGVRMNYPSTAMPVGEGTPPFDMAPTNAADGAPPVGPILLHLGRDVRADQLVPQDRPALSTAPRSAVALFNMATGARVLFMSEMDRNRKTAYPDRYAMIIRPLMPMDTGARHIVAVARELADTAGLPFDSPPAFAALRDGVPTDNETVEAMRPRFEEVFSFLEGKGYPRGELLIAWDFMVASEGFLTGSVLSMREEALKDAMAPSFAYTIEMVKDDPDQYLARLIEGTFEVPTYLRDDNTFEYDADHRPVRQEKNQSFPFTMIIPKKARTQAPLPLAVFGHGIFGTGKEYLNGWGSGISHPLAEAAGTVMVATDWIGLSRGDMDIILKQVVPDLNKISVITDRLQQSLVNNLVLTETALGALSHDKQVWESGELLDPSRVYYYGVSLGGIQGSSFVSLSNRITRGALAVPGCAWMDMFPRSIHWTPIKAVLDLNYPDPLDQQVGIALVQTRFDLSDPVNLSRLMFTHPLPGAPKKTVILQEAIGDSQVPNLTTEMLARIMGVGQMHPPIYPVEGLEQVFSPTQKSVLTQYYLVEQVLKNPPPADNVPPAKDNGAHSDMVFLENVQEQVLHFVETGEIVQYCTGLCDPD
jgi:hypothetical protein